jgi:hypothetical protein
MLTIFDFVILNYLWATCGLEHYSIKDNKDHCHLQDKYWVAIDVIYINDKPV